jgi:hypothetical protein
VHGRELRILLDKGVGEDARGPLSTGKVNKGVMGPQCIVDGWFRDSTGWWFELLRYTSPFAPAPGAGRGKGI